MSEFSCYFPLCRASINGPRSHYMAQGGLGLAESHMLPRDHGPRAVIREEYATVTFSTIFERSTAPVFLIMFRHDLSFFVDTTGLDQCTPSTSLLVFISFCRAVDRMVESLSRFFYQ